MQTQIHVQSRQERLLACIPRTSTLKEACKEAGITYGTFCVWRRANPAFKQAADDAIAERSAWIEEKLQHWCENGEVTEKYDKDGNLVSVTRKPCSQLIIKALESYSRAQFGRQKSDPEDNLLQNQQDRAPAIFVPVTVEHSEWEERAKRKAEEASQRESQYLIDIGEVIEHE